MVNRMIYLKGGKIQCDSTLGTCMYLRGGDFYVKYSIYLYFWHFCEHFCETFDQGQRWITWLQREMLRTESISLFVEVLGIFIDFLSNLQNLIIDHEAREIMYLVASVRLSVCPSVCPSGPTLTAEPFDLDIWHVGWPWPWLGWDCRSRS